MPYFRCSDNDVVKIYYYLWSIYLMYFTVGDSGMELHPHTQSAVHNFLGMHRFDGVFQIMAGAWTSPAEHHFYANGNVLSWNLTMPFRRGSQLPDNFGKTWVSGLYGGEMIAHVIGAWTIYEHSGNRSYLQEAYSVRFEHKAVPRTPNQYNPTCSRALCPAHTAGTVRSCQP